MHIYIHTWAHAHTHIQAWKHTDAHHVVFLLLESCFSIIGRKEDLCDKLRSILSQLKYAYKICIWEDDGVAFKTHFYVPEVHPATKAEFHECEDDAHILKVSI